MKEIVLQGNKKELIEILEFHIAYLQAIGYDNDNHNSQLFSRLISLFLRPFLVKYYKLYYFNI